jgi:hypothetical protein
MHRPKLSVSLLICVLAIGLFVATTSQAAINSVLVSNVDAYFGSQSDGYRQERSVVRCAPATSAKQPPVRSMCHPLSVFSAARVERTASSPLFNSIVTVPPRAR